MLELFRSGSLVLVGLLLASLTIGRWPGAAKDGVTPETAMLLATLLAELHRDASETERVRGISDVLDTFGANGALETAMSAIVASTTATDAEKLSAIEFVVHDKRSPGMARYQGTAGQLAGLEGRPSLPATDTSTPPPPTATALDAAATRGLAAANPPAEQAAPAAVAAAAPDGTGGADAMPYCTAKQMRSKLVPQGPGVQASWAPRRYDPKCRTIGKNYKCHNRPNFIEFLKDDTNRQVPLDAAEGRCRLHAAAAGDYPYPPGSRILYWGNSHMREIIHSLTCQFGNAKRTTRGTGQESACAYEDYKIEPDQDEVMFAYEYDNNSTAYGVCNCGLMYDRATGLPSVARLLGMDIGQLTHVIANPANVAKWATQWKFTTCTNEPWPSLRNLSNAELFNWNPFSKPADLGKALRMHGFKGKLIWTLPFWCMNNAKANRYRHSIPPDMLDSEYVDGVVDFSEFVCPDPKFRCETAGCAKGRAGSHQCLPGPPDDIAGAVLHLVSTLSARLYSNSTKDPLTP